MEKKKATVDTETGEVQVTIPVRKWRTPYNHNEFPKQGEVFVMPSLTIPDETYTIPELMQRMRRNQPLGAPTFEASFTGEEEFFPEINKLDLADQETILKAKMADINRAKQSQKQKEHDALVQRQVNAKLKAQAEALAAQQSKGESNPSTTL